MINKINCNGGVQSRMAFNLHQEVKDIMESRIKKHGLGEELSIEKITSLIARHDYWQEIKEDIINIKSEDLNKI